MDIPKEGLQTDSERQKQRIDYTPADRVIDSKSYPKGLTDSEVFDFTIGENCPSLSYGLMKQLFQKSSWRQLSKPQQRFINQIVLMVDKTFAGRRDVDVANQGDNWTFHLPKEGEVPATFTFLPRKGRGISINGAPLEYFGDVNEEKRFHEANRRLLEMNGIGANMSLTDALKQLRQNVSYKDRVRILRDEGKVWSAERVQNVGGYLEVLDSIDEEMRNMMRLPGISEGHKQEIFNAWREQKLDKKGGPNSNLNYKGTGFQNLAWLISIRRLMKNPPTEKEVKAALIGIGFLGGYEIVDPKDNIVFQTREATQAEQEFDYDAIDWGDEDSTKAWDELPDTASDWGSLPD